MRALSKLFEPLIHCLFCFRLRVRSIFKNSDLSSRYTFKNLHPILHKFKIFYIY